MKTFYPATFLTLLATATSTEAFQSKSLSTSKVSSSILHSTEAPKIYSKSLPFMEQPVALDGTYAGDVGFDPLNFAKDEKWLMNMREAEVKHARLAMLAAAGWPVSELLDRTLADAINLPSTLDEAGRVPSLLNGGLGKIPLAYWGFVLLLGSAVEVYGLTKVNEPDYVPGNFKIDPFKITAEDNEVSKWVTLAEIKNGRLAMVAITAYAVLEFAQHRPVVESFEFLF
mmetsp:Transcript_26292/g.57593  ORF Transcript_26292/g.57593 Transcript_26292/m.57593 type:complete len:228 (-) Transcript_26292:306-989(-)|eukprot:CAMPEP_0168168858 /NCGR_PEP_ID=MMETSP0139_2-20121125/3332_1 /TAXON_ID=44445 /ORGANISM="Pseudo-nitzschia australis, Strain 10249 10 AB" /LENGTH=227 /DNA_ID=CAMNT_0008086245 /DNA_START=22 /DNA_END=705 /DNA_ORIENTATION=-